jgi:hypothetical protein
VSATFDRVRELARQRNVYVSRHGYARLAARGILIADVVAGAADGEATRIIRATISVLRSSCCREMEPISRCTWSGASRRIRPSPQ